ncbi:hypothetical protein RHMOL_Rhmol08G0303900 [Rhododendron molle]|uniref:Uncharacterized protein n=1 Tax=Rhododendron molle TaxID=49168 RepID=A0ACC0MW59_RHOML|nr:hypothetical protein RHMOL_Rhmol08G0303900 [Rhododendron molle]
MIRGSGVLFVHPGILLFVSAAGHSSCGSKESVRGADIYMIESYCVGNFCLTTLTSRATCYAHPSWAANQVDFPYFSFWYVRK